MSIFEAGSTLSSWASEFEDVCFASFFKSTAYLALGDLLLFWGREKDFGTSSRD